MKTMEQCVMFLAESDQLYAESKAKVKYLDKKLKVVKAHAFLKSEGTIAEREAKAYTDDAYKDCLEEYKNACLDMETLGVERETINVRVEIWRTKSANQRRGNI